MPHISIIIPVYNTEKYIFKCIDSLLQQTFQNFEIICIDDGSTDNSVDIIKNYQNQDTRIKLFQQKNSGPGSARNLGIKNSTGEFICLLDSDDFLTNDALEILYNEQKKNFSDIVIAKLRLFDNKTDETIKIRGWRGKNISANHQYNISNLYKNLFQIVSPVATAKLFNSKILKENNILFSDYKMAEDALFIYTYLTYCAKISFTDKIVYQYRINISENLTSQNSDYFLDFNKSFLALKDVILQRNLYSKLKKTWFRAYMCCFIHILKISNIKTKFLIFNKSLLVLLNNIKELLL